MHDCNFSRGWRLVDTAGYRGTDRLPWPICCCWCCCIRMQRETHRRCSRRGLLHEDRNQPNMSAADKKISRVRSFAKPAPTRFNHVPAQSPTSRSGMTTPSLSLAQTSRSWRFEDPRPPAGKGRGGTAWPAPCSSASLRLGSSASLTQETRWAHSHTQATAAWSAAAGWGTRRQCPCGRNLERLRALRAWERRWRRCQQHFEDLRRTKTPNQPSFAAEATRNRPEGTPTPPQQPQ